jgi:predicted membrane protein
MKAIKLALCGIVVTLILAVWFTYHSMFKTNVDVFEYMEARDVFLAYLVTNWIIVIFLLLPALCLAAFYRLWKHEDKKKRREELAALERRIEELESERNG